MAIPTTYLAALLLAISSMLCWGSWANTMKSVTGPKWRFELFYIDYAIGLLLCALFVAFTFGMLGSSITFLDNLEIVRKRQQVMAAAAGAVFNLANMLLVAAISVAGMAIAFPVGIGLALIIGVVWSYILSPRGNPLFLFGGCLFVLAGIVATAIAYSVLQKKKAAEAPKQPQPQPRDYHRGRSSSSAKPSQWKGIVLSLVSGVLMGSFYPLVEQARRDDIEMGAYAIAVLFAVGVFLSTPIYSLFFMNLPVQGQPVSPLKYLKGTGRQHAFGLLGGAIWCVGAIANFVAASAPPAVQVGPATSYALGQGATLISTLWGLLVWKEFEGAPATARSFIGGALVLYVIGLALVAAAPLFA
ncbi:MAG: GRP family sugar transporter [Bryobacteraceae bacterium]